MSDENNQTQQTDGVSLRKEENNVTPMSTPENTQSVNPQEDQKQADPQGNPWVAQPVNGPEYQNQTNQGTTAPGQPANYTYGNGSYQNPPRMYMDGQYQNEKKGGNGFAIASLVLGIVSLVLFCCCINVVTAILSVVFAIIHLVQRREGKGMAIAGIVTSVVSVILTVIMIFGFSMVPYAMSDIENDLNGDSNPFEQFEEYYDNGLTYDDGTL